VNHPQSHVEKGVKMGRVALTIGNFDGVHIGHRVLVEQCRAEVGQDGKVVVLAFDPHPMMTLNAEYAPVAIEPFELRRERLIEIGADEVVALNPTPEFLAKAPEQFVNEIIDTYRPGVIIEGHDFHFGKRRSGTPTVLRELAGIRGVDVKIVKPIEVALTDQTIVIASSTITRWLIEHGRVRDCAYVLGRAHELVGTVIKGDQLGRRIGFATANLETESMLPSNGVYGATVVTPSGRVVGGAVNVGKRPTVQGTDLRAEVHLFEGDGSAWSPEEGMKEYGWEIRVRLIGWIRDQVQFANVDVLSEQLGRDVVKARGMVSGLIDPTMSREVV
jgi:riboflavin kinase / FMN adenylyltransferase